MTLQEATTEIKAIIDHFDKDNSPYDEFDVACKLKSLRDNRDGLDKDAFIAIISDEYPFAFHEYESDSPWGGYFGPRGRAGNISDPDLNLINAEMIKHWKKRAQELQHPRLLARYADAIWDVTKTATSDRPDRVFAEIAIDAYLKDLKNPSKSIHKIRRLRRAMQLVLSIGKVDRKNIVKEAYFALEDELKNEPGCKNQLFLYDDLYALRKKMFLSDQEVEEIIYRLEEHF